MRLVEPPQLVELASGVDSFYISGRSRLPEALIKDLEDARSTARETRIAVELAIGADVFMVSGSGLNRYPYRLQHRHGLIGLTTSSSLPTVTVQPNASLIHAVGIRAAIGWFVDAVQLLLGRVDWKASRVDLFMDSQGWDLVAEDRDSFVCRAKQRVMYEDDATLRTLMFGSAKSGVKARIYDKTEEARQKGTDWWPAVWGDVYTPGERVLRVEFQVSREVLKQSKIDTPGDAMERLPQLWGYLTDRWLTLRNPSEDETRSRWPVAAEWQYVQQASLRGGAVGLARVADGAQAGNMRKLLPQLRGYLASAGAILGAETLEETLHRVGRRLALDEMETGYPFAARLRDKRLAVGA